jgi:hypothetical protein
MKSNTKILFIALIIILSAYSCSPRGDGSVSVVDVNGSKMYVTSLQGLSSNTVTVPLSRLVESLELVQLETKDEAFFRPQFTTVTEKYIGIKQQSGRPYLLFDRSGRFLGNVGSVGSGPGEYSMTPYDDIIDDENGLIYLAPFMGSNILVYNTSGAFLRSIVAPQRLNKSKIFLSDDALAVFHKSFSEDSPMAFQMTIPTGNYAVNITTGEVADLSVENPRIHAGQVISELATPAHFVVRSFDGEIFTSRNVEGVFDFLHTNTDTLFHFDMKSNRIVPVFTMASGEGIWKNYFQVNRDLIMIGVNEFNAESRQWVNRGTMATDLKNMTSSYVNIVNDFFGNLPVQASVLTFRNGYFVYNVQPEELIDEIENRLAGSNVSQSDRQQLEELLSRLEEGTNNVVFIGKLKNGIEEKLW